jgi:hypothetical protein
MRNTLFITLLAGLIIASGVALAQEPTARIQNRWLEVTWQSDGGELQIRLKDGTHAFFTSRDILLGVKQPRMIEFKHGQFGKGTAFEFVAPSGEHARVALYEALPFVVFDRQLRNSDAKEAVVKKVHFLNGKLDLGVNVAQLATISTAGLRPIVAHPGGYSFMAIGHPKTRKGVVCGWLTAFRGTGIVGSDVVDGSGMLKAHIDYGDLRIPSGSEVSSETLVLGCFDDVRAGLEQYADAIATRLEIRLLPKQTVYCTWYHSGASSEKAMAPASDFAAKQFMPFGFTTMQIDDGWQDGISTNGPKRNFMNVNPKGAYPNGMKPTADYVRSRGMVAGIWFLPFAGTPYDPFFADKQDWFYKMDGKPYEVRWGGGCLDMTHPEARAYLGGLVRRIAKEWGYKYFKMDGLWTGTGTELMYVTSAYRDDNLGKATRHDPSLTPVEAYRLGLTVVRKEAGDDVFLLGCCQPQNMRSFAPALGLLDAMRVGPDNGANPAGIRTGPQFASRVFFLNGRVWYNDPDPVYVRGSLPEPMAETSISWSALSGSLHSSSETYSQLPPERLDMLKRSMPAHELKTTWPVDYLESDIPQVWLLTDDRRKERHDVVGIFNWDIKSSAHVEYPLDRIGLPAAKAYVGFDYWRNQFLPPFSNSIAGDLPPGGCRVLSLRPVSGRPLLVGTSRHLTQGAVDLLEEEWTGSVLRGRSNVVADDPYELRVVVPVGEHSWKLDSVTVAGINSSFQQDGPTIRVRLEPSKTTAISWELTFRRGPVDAGKVAAIAALATESTKWWAEGVRISWEPAAHALSYRITRKAGASVTVLETVAPRFTDNKLKAAQAYTYIVEGCNWNGEWSPPATVTVQLPSLPERPNDPSLPTVRCDQLKPISARVGRGILGINKSFSGKPLTLAGKVYPSGLGAHAPSTLIYAIPKGSKRFVSIVGLDDEVKTDTSASVVFRIVGDVKEMGEQPVVLAESPRLDNVHIRTWSFDVELDPRFREIQLVVTDAGDGMSSDHADWVDAGFM